MSDRENPMVVYALWREPVVQGVDEDDPRWDEEDE